MRTGIKLVACAWAVVGFCVLLGLACYQVSQWGRSDAWGFVLMGVVLSIATVIIEAVLERDTQ